MQFCAYTGKCKSYYTVPKAFLVSEKLQDKSLNIPLYFYENLRAAINPSLIS
jgi:hypothetical protein